MIKPPTEVPMVEAYIARRRIKIAPDRWCEPAPRGEDPKNGDVVAEAFLWTRVESWEHTGYLIKAEVPVERFLAAVRASGLSEDRQREVLVRTPLDGQLLNGPHRTPFSRKASKPAKRKARKVAASKRTGPTADRRSARKVAEQNPAPVPSDAPAPKLALKTRKPKGAPLIAQHTIDADEEATSFELVE